MRTFACLLAVAWLAGCATTEDAVIDVPCPDIVAGCALPQASLAVRFDRMPQPMQRFVMLVELPRAQSVQASFGMQDMEMGPNRYRLLADGPGRWRAEVMLPACVQGRHDWLLTLEADGTRYRLPFRSL